MTIPYEKILGVEEQDEDDLDWQEWEWEEWENWQEKEYGIIDGGHFLPTINTARQI